MPDVSILITANDNYSTAIKEMSSATKKSIIKNFLLEAIENNAIRR